MSRLLVVPAAGRGSRLATGTPKPLVRVAGRAMLDRLADLYAPFVDGIVVIANPQSRAAIDDWARRRGAIVAEQPSPTGMLDAILLAASAIDSRRPHRVWITWADQVGVLPATLARLADAETADPAPAMIVPTVQRRDPYIHFTRDRDGRIAGLLQRREGDAMPAEGESDIGVFAIAGETFRCELPLFGRDATAGAGTGERNFLPFIPWLARRKPVVTLSCSDPMEAIGINTPGDLHAVEAWLRARNSA